MRLSLGCPRNIFTAAVTILLFLAAWPPIPTQLAPAEPPSTIAGTLIVMVPSNAGLVVAADSRTSPVKGIDCDNQVKIFEPTRPNQTILTVTGTPTILEPSSDPVPLGRICDYINSATRILDIRKVVQDFLEESGAETIAALDMSALVKRCIDATRSALAQGGIKLHLRRTQDMFSVVIAAYDPQTSSSAARSFVIGLTRQLDPVLATTFERKATPDDNQNYWAFGETDYLYRQVLRGIGRRYLSPATTRFYTTRRPVRDVSVEEARALAVDLIAATARTTAVVPAPGGIGGPIDVVLVGKEPRPQHLQWKSP
jgi:hypothetical protein